MSHPFLRGSMQMLSDAIRRMTEMAGQPAVAQPGDCSLEEEVVMALRSAVVALPESPLRVVMKRTLRRAERRWQC